MNKNLVTFIALSLSIYLGWIYYMGKRYPHMAEDRAKAAAAAAAAKAGKNDASAVSAASPSKAPGAAPVASKGASSPKGARAQSVTIKTEAVEAVFSSAGAKLSSLKLLGYREHNDQPEPVQLIPHDGQYGAFELSGTSLDSEVWAVEKSDAQHAVFSTSIAGTPISFRKTFSFEPQGFVITVKLDVINSGKEDKSIAKSFLLWGPGIGLHQEGRQAAANDGGTVQMEGKLERESPGDPKVFGYQAPKWIAVKNHYFVAAFINDGGFPEGELRRETLDGVTRTVSAALGLGAIVIKGGETKSYSTRLYAGPQDYSTLKSFKNNLNAVVQFSFQWLSPLSVFLLSIMRFFFGLVNNWGFAVILLTVFVKLALFYPTHRGMASSRRMQTQMAKMAPVLESLKKTYKDDAAKLQQETMRLYKEHGVNPLSGCFLMLPQMFIMISLYGALNGAFELRGASFIGPWHDLSAPDPTFILVPLMGASMWLQQKLAPVNTATMSEDQAQMQKMMTTMMPVMFTVMGFIFKWPTGLLLYWSVSNVFGIAQQWYVNKTVK